MRLAAPAAASRCTDRKRFQRRFLLRPTKNSCAWRGPLSAQFGPAARHIEARGLLLPNQQKKTVRHLPHRFLSIFAHRLGRVSDVKRSRTAPPSPAAKTTTLHGGEAIPGTLTHNISGNSNAHRQPSLSLRQRPFHNDRFHRFIFLPRSRRSRCAPACAAKSVVVDSRQIPSRSAKQISNLTDRRKSCTKQELIAVPQRETRRTPSPHAAERPSTVDLRA